MKAISRGREVIPYENYEELKYLVMRVLTDMIKNTRGNCITFTSKKIALKAGLNPQPILLTVIREILESLRERNVIRRYSKSSRGIKYIITSNSPLWTAVRSNLKIIR